MGKGQLSSDLHKAHSDLVRALAEAHRFCPNAVEEIHDAINAVQAALVWVNMKHD